MDLFNNFEVNIEPLEFRVPKYIKSEADVRTYLENQLRFIHSAKLKSYKPIP